MVSHSTSVANMYQSDASNTTVMMTVVKAMLGYYM